MAALHKVGESGGELSAVPLFENKILLACFLGSFVFFLGANLWLSLPSEELSRFLAPMVSELCRSFDSTYGVYSDWQFMPAWIKSTFQWTQAAQYAFAAFFILVISFAVRSVQICRRFSNSRAIPLLASLLFIAALLPATIFMDRLCVLSCKHIAETSYELFNLKSGVPGFDEVCKSGLLALYAGGFFGSLLLLKYLMSPSLYLRLDKFGLFLGASSWSKFIGERSVLWSEIDSVHLKTENNGKNTLELKLKDGSYTFDCAYLQTHVNLRDLQNALRSYSSCQIRAEGVELNSAPSGQYTELWLKYFSNATERKRSDTLKPGDTLQEGRYLVDCELGQGGQGTVYLASLASTEGEAIESGLVLKEYILPLHRGEEIFQHCLSKLKREAEILQRISHPNIVSCRGCFVEDHRGYLVMEYVEGKSLKALVELEGAFAAESVENIALQIADILDYLHSQDPPIIHRDLTPDNLILQSDGKLKLVDFNVAQQLEPSARASVVGKHAYIPPEQFRGKPVLASDIYAAGATLYYLLTGMEPDPMSVLHPKRIRTELSESMDTLVSKCTALDLTERFQSAADIKQALRAETEGISLKISLAKEELLGAGE